MLAWLFERKRTVQVGLIQYTVIRTGLRCINDSGHGGLFLTFDITNSVKERSRLRSRTLITVSLERASTSGEVETNPTDRRSALASVAAYGGDFIALDRAGSNQIDASESTTVAIAISHVTISAIANEPELRCAQALTVYLDGISTIYQRVLARNLANTTGPCAEPCSSTRACASRGR